MKVHSACSEATIRSFIGSPNFLNERPVLAIKFGPANSCNVSDAIQTREEWFDGLFPATLWTFGGLPTSCLPSSAPLIDLTLQGSKLHHTISKEGRGVTTEWISFKRRAFRSSEWFSLR